MAMLRGIIFLACVLLSIGAHLSLDTYRITANHGISTAQAIAHGINTGFMWFAPGLILLFAAALQNFIKKSQTTK